MCPSASTPSRFQCLLKLVGQVVIRLAGFSVINCYGSWLLLSNRHTLTDPQGEVRCVIRLFSTFGDTSSVAQFAQAIPFL